MLTSKETPIVVALSGIYTRIKVGRETVHLLMAPEGRGIKLEFKPKRKEEGLPSNGQTVIVHGHLAWDDKGVPFLTVTKKNAFTNAPLGEARVKTRFVDIDAYSYEDAWCYASFSGKMEGPHSLRTDGTDLDVTYIDGVEPPPIEKLVTLYGYFDMRKENPRLIVKAWESEVAKKTALEAQTEIYEAAMRLREPRRGEFHQGMIEGLLKAVNALIPVTGVNPYVDTPKNCIFDHDHAAHPEKCQFLES